MNFALTVLLADTWGMHGDDVGTGWMIVMMVVMLLFWAAVILGIVWLVRGGATGNWSLPARRSETPTDILERRFAEGEISAEDYRERREVIANGGS
jgi:putative membrane protein